MQINSEEMALQTNNKTYHRKSPLFENLKDEVIFLLHDLTAGSRIFIQSSQKYSCVSKERKFGHRKIPYSRKKLQNNYF